MSRLPAEIWREIYRYVFDGVIKQLEWYAEEGRDYCYWARDWETASHVERAIMLFSFERFAETICRTCGDYIPRIQYTESPKHMGVYLDIMRNARSHTRKC
nr:hypothetical protein K-LCC10_0229 [Kaumoebavirus]